MPLATFHQCLTSFTRSKTLWTQNIYIENFRNLATSVPRHLQMAIEAKREMTKYSNVNVTMPLKMCVHVCEKQGFTRHCIFIAFMDLENMCETRFQHTLSIAFLDLEKTYDRINWDVLKKILRKHGVGGKLLQAEKFEKFLSRLLGVCASRKQEVANEGWSVAGCVVSLCQFKLFMEGVVSKGKCKSWKEERIRSLGIESAVAC